MSLTLTKVAGPFTIGNRWQSIYTAAVDNSYPTGGWALAPASLGFASTADPTFDVRFQNVDGHFASYDYTNQKLKLFSHTQVYTATFDAASLAATTSRDDSITFTGVASTDIVVAVIPPPAAAASVVVQAAHVSATDTIIARLTNSSAGAVDLASGTWTAIVRAASGASKEVANATDLSAALTAIRITAVGHFRG